MKKIVAEIFIPVQPEQIWQVLTDAGSHSEWNTQIIRIKGRLAPGERPSIRVHAPIGEQWSFGFKGKIVTFEEGKRMAWEGGIPGVLNGHHYWHLIPEEHGTRVIHGEEFAGMFSPLLTSSLLKKMQPTYEQSNIGLKNFMLQ